MTFLLLIGIVSGCYPVPVSDNSAVVYSDTDYYYYPDQEVYYYPATSQYIYYDGGGWTYATLLPPRYSVNLYTTNHVLLNYSGRDPYRYHERYTQEYPRGYRGQRLTAPARQSNAVPARQSNYRQQDLREGNTQRQASPAKQPRVKRTRVENPAKTKPVKAERRVGGRVKRSEK